MIRVALVALIAAVPAAPATPSNVCIEVLKHVDAVCFQRGLVAGKADQVVMECVDSAGRSFDVIRIRGGAI